MVWRLHAVKMCLNLDVARIVRRRSKNEEIAQRVREEAKDASMTFFDVKQIIFMSLMMCSERMLAIDVRCRFSAAESSAAL